MMEEKVESMLVMRYMRMTSMGMMLLGVMMMAGGGWIIWDSLNTNR